MADFKFQGTTPAVGNIKLGSSNVSKIYSGSTQVWPAAAGGCSYTFENSTVLRNAVNLWFSDNTAALAEYGPMSEWCTENVTSMNNLFKDRTTFNEDISNWDVGNVTLMTQMFYNTPLFNQDIGGWDVRNVDRMDLMFYAPQDQSGNRSSAFNQDLGAWDVSNVNYMRSMFVGCSSFNNGGSDSIGNWDVSNVGSDVFSASFDFTFFYATSFNQDLSEWCVSRYSPSNTVGRVNFSGFSALTPAHTPAWGTCPAT